MNNLYITLNKIQTHLITFGNPLDCYGKDVIVCITGNPGLPDFYKEFGSALHKSTGFPVCIVGQAGHEVVPDVLSNTLENRKHLFNLEGQIKHKTELLKSIVDKDCNLHLIGHSIGAWIVTEILSDSDDIFARVASVNFLFPTLQNIADTKNGVFLNMILRNIHKFIILLITCLCMLPNVVFNTLIRIYLAFSFLPQHYIERIKKYINPLVIDKVLFLAYDEMDVVQSLNTEALEKIKHLIYVIYSGRDGWVPLCYMADLEPYQPYLRMQRVEISHAFVLKSSETIAELVSRSILRKKMTKKTSHIE